MGKYCSPYQLKIWLYVTLVCQKQTYLTKTRVSVTWDSLSLLNETQTFCFIEGNADKPEEWLPCLLRTRYISESIFLVPSSLLSRGPSYPPAWWLAVCWREWVAAEWKAEDGRTQSLTAQSVPTLSYFWMSISSGINAYSNGIASFAKFWVRLLWWICNIRNHTALMRDKYMQVDCWSCPDSSSGIQSLLHLCRSAQKLELESFWFCNAG